MVKHMLVTNKAQVIEIEDEPKLAKRGRVKYVYQKPYDGGSTAAFNECRKPRVEEYRRQIEKIFKEEQEKKPNRQILNIEHCRPIEFIEEHDLC